MTPTDFRDRYKNLTIKTATPDGKSVSFAGLHVDTYAMYSGYDSDAQHKMSAVWSAALQYNTTVKGEGLPLESDAFIITLYMPDLV